MMRILFATCLFLSQLLALSQAQNLDEHIVQEQDSDVLQWALPRQEQATPEQAALSNAQQQQLRTADAVSQVFGGDVLDDRLNDYISYVGLSVARHSRLAALPWRFIIINQSAPLIFSSGNFQIAVSRGLLTQLDNEAELAFLLAHTMAHIQLHYESTRKPSEAELEADGREHSADTKNAHRLVSQLVPSSLLNQILDPAVSDVLESLEHHYTTSEELHADEVAIKALQAAGYSPQAVVTLQEDFAAIAKLSPNPWRFVFAVHSPATQRIEAARDQARLLGPGAQAQARYTQQLAAYRQHKAAFDSLLQADSQCQQGNTTEGIALLRHAMHGNPGEAQLALSLARCLIKEQKPDEALAALADAAKLDPFIYQIYLEQARLLVSVKQYQNAQLALQRSYRLLPLAETRLRLGTLALAQGDFSTAEDQLAPLAATPRQSSWHQQAFAIVWQARLQQRASDYLICELEQRADSNGTDNTWRLSIKNLSPVSVENVHIRMTVGEVNSEYLWQTSIAASARSPARKLASLGILGNPEQANVIATMDAKQNPIFCSVTAASQSL